jgi:hypothetical protein
MTPKDECGRELRANELREQTVVWLAKDGEEQKRRVTMWVVSVRPNVIDFYSGVLDLTLRCTRLADETLRAHVNGPDHAKRIHVYEYLGKL